MPTAISPLRCHRSFRRLHAVCVRHCATPAAPKHEYTPPASLRIGGRQFDTDGKTNVTERIASLSTRNLLQMKGNALRLLKMRIESHFNERYTTGRRPLFSIVDGLHPVVTPWQNFDSLLVPLEHVSRKSSDTYYVNEQLCLRAHTSAHQHELLKSGLDNFLVFGDVYRRDTVDRTHFPVFHQMEAVRLYSRHELFPSDDAESSTLQLFERSADEARKEDKQETHTRDAVQVVEAQLKDTLEGLAKSLFGQDVKYRWVSCYFPFTHPSWELEVWHDGDWLETLGCGIMEQSLLESAGAGHKMGWAFGLGLERLAMRLYGISDIRTFWSTDSGITRQFDTDDFAKDIQFKPISRHPQCYADISFWLPHSEAPNRCAYSPHDFYDIVRSIGGDLVEQVDLFDEFYNSKLRRHSHAYRIVYRHMARALTQEEVNATHERIADAVINQLHAEIR